MKKIFLFLGLLIFSTVSFADTLIFKNFGLKAITTWEAKPASTSKEAVMRVQFEDARGTPVEVDASDFTVELFMPEMGHGSGPTSLERILDHHDDVIPGLYRVKNMWFIMNGMWEVRVNMSNGTNSETQVLKVTL